MLIQPVLRGEALLRDIHETTLLHDQIALWWLGQSGYILKTAHLTAAIDPYLSEHLTIKYANTDKPHVRMTDTPIRGDALTGLDYLLVTHKHSDHLDPISVPEILNASPNARLILPNAIVPHAVTLGIDHARMLPMRGGDHVTLSAHVSVQSFPSAHPEFDESPEGFPFIGYGIAADGIRLYHSGDTLLYDDLGEAVKDFAPDIMLLPINGTTPLLLAGGTPPNMNAEDAVRLAELVAPQLVIPMHYDMFAFNTVDVRTFTDAADAHHVPYRVLKPGEKFVWTKPQS